MIVFASLFLGLVFGERPVELVVGEAVAVVEMRLDGELLGTLREEPWILDCDFGDELAPRHLEAIAYDAAGKELGRVEQWLNLPRARAVANVVLGPRRDDGSRIAKLRWESSAGAEPEAVRVSLDGRPLAVSDPREFTVPKVNETELHLLQVELDFERRTSARVDLTFGGSYADEVSTAITALALEATDGKRKKGPSVEDLQGIFRVGDEELEVLTVEQPEAEMIFVLDRPFPRMVMPGERYKPPKSLYLDGDERVRFLSTEPRESRGVSTNFALFPISPAYGGDWGDLYSLLSRLIRPSEGLAPRPATAVAVAGLAAYESRRRRAVIYVPSSTAPKEDALDPGEVSRYLDRLGVPLFVWNPEGRAAEHVKAWGTSYPVGSLDKLGDAYAEIIDRLDRQWIVWLDGRHLPQDIELSPEAEGFEIVGQR